MPRVLVLSWSPHKYLLPEIARNAEVLPKVARNAGAWFCSVRHYSNHDANAHCASAATCIVYQNEIHVFPENLSNLNPRADSSGFIFTVRQNESLTDVPRMSLYVVTAYSLNSESSKGDGICNTQHASCAGEPADSDTDPARRTKFRWRTKPQDTVPRADCDWIASQFDTTTGFLGKRQAHVHFWNWKVRSKQIISHDVWWFSDVFVAFFMYTHCQAC